MKSLLLFILFSIIVSGENAAQTAGGFKDYKKNIELIKSKYEDPWYSETTPGPYRSIEGLKFVQFIERKYLNEDPAICNIWIITRTGNIYKENDIELALQDIKYFPSSEKEAMRLAVVILEHKYRYCDIITGDEDIKEYVPVELVQKSELPKVVSKDDTYEVCLYVSHYFAPRIFGKKPDRYELRKYSIIITKYRYTVKDIETVEKLKSEGNMNPK